MEGPIVNKPNSTIPIIFIDSTRYDTSVSYYHPLYPYLHSLVFHAVCITGFIFMTTFTL